MASAESVLKKSKAGGSRIDFATSPEQYRHWQLEVEGAVARLTLRVQEDAPLHHLGAGQDMTSS